MNFVPLLLSGVAALAIGAVYYHPKVFGTMWMHASGLTEEKIKGSNMAVIFGITFLMAVLIAMYMGNDMAEHIKASPDFHGKSGPFGHGAAHGLATSLFLVIPIIVTISLFERRNFKYILSHALYWILTMMAISSIVTGMA